MCTLLLYAFYIFENGDMSNYVNCSTECCQTACKNFNFSLCRGYILCGARFLWISRFVSFSSIPGAVSKLAWRRCYPVSMYLTPLLNHIRRLPLNGKLEWIPQRNLKWFFPELTILLCLTCKTLRSLVFWICCLFIVFWSSFTARRLEPDYKRPWSRLRGVIL